MNEVYQVGRRIRTPQEMDALPVGSVVYDSRHRYRKQATDSWSEVDYGTRYGRYDFAMNGSVRIGEFPGGLTSFEVPQQTAEQVKWQFRVGALAAAAQHGVGVETVEETLRMMGCGREDVAPTLGHGVTVPVESEDRAATAALPDGSVVFSGSPQNPSGLSVHAKRNGQWVLVLGERNHFGGEVIIESINGNREPPEWLTREGNEKDRDAIAEFKARAWRIGWKLKKSQGWCSTYESIVQRLGVSQADTQVTRYRGLGVGDRITAMEAAQLPEGSLLWWQHADDENRWALFVRNSASTNGALTLRVAGSDESNENYRRYMTVASVADEAGDVIWRIPEQPNNVWLALPPGVVFTYRHGEAAEYIKCLDGSIASNADALTTVPQRGNYRLDQFGTNPEFAMRRIVR